MSKLGNLKSELYMKKRIAPGFTLVELIVVIIILGVLAVTAAPRFFDIGSDARRATLGYLASQMDSANRLVQNTARIRGLRPTETNPATGPGQNSQPAFVVDFGFGMTEVSFFNLCPEARAENGDALEYFEFVIINDTGEFERSITNQFAAIGYDIPTAGPPTASGCYVYYDSFDRSCTVQVVDVDC